MLNAIFGGNGCKRILPMFPVETFHEYRHHQNSYPGIHFGLSLKNDDSGLKMKNSEILKFLKKVP